MSATSSWGREVKKRQHKGINNLKLHCTRLTGWQCLLVFSNLGPFQTSSMQACQGQSARPFKSTSPFPLIRVTAATKQVKDQPKNSCSLSTRERSKSRIWQQVKTQVLAQYFSFIIHQARKLDRIHRLLLLRTLSLFLFSVEALSRA